MSSIIGHRFPDGTLRIQLHEDWFVRDAVGSEVRTSEHLHGGWMLLGPLRGIGIEVVEMINVFGANFEDGVVFGEAVVEQVRPLCAHRDYRISAGVTDVQRRHGTAIASFDVVTFEVIASDAEGVAVRCINSFIIPREG